MTKFKRTMMMQQIKWREKEMPEVPCHEYYDKKTGAMKQSPYSFAENCYIYNFCMEAGSDLFSGNGYLERNNIKPHDQIHNTLSSWAACANMYWSFNNESGRVLLAGFLREQTGIDIARIISMDLEYESDKPYLKQSELLGERNGCRGEKQTSPDIGIEFETTDGKRGLLLCEYKFTEADFQACSGSRSDACKNFDWQKNADRCPKTVAGRKYWEILTPYLGSGFLSLDQCMFSENCYQLMRQQALAIAMANEKHGDYAIVASIVLSPRGNKELIESANTFFSDNSKDAGLFTKNWRRLFHAGQEFSWLFHDDWLAYVKKHNDGEWSDWLDYMHERYFAHLTAQKNSGCGC